MSHVACHDITCCLPRPFLWCHNDRSRRIFVELRSCCLDLYSSSRDWVPREVLHYIQLRRAKANFSDKINRIFASLELHFISIVLFRVAAAPAGRIIKYIYRINDGITLHVRNLLRSFLSCLFSLFSMLRPSPIINLFSNNCHLIQVPCISTINNHNISRKVLFGFHRKIIIKFNHYNTKS